MPQKTLVGDRDAVLLIPAFELSGIPQLAFPTGATAQPITAVTSALLNYYMTTVTPAGAAANWGGNISCAILEDWKLVLKDSDSKNVRTLCSVGQAQELTFYNYDANINILRDINPADTTSEFNLAFQLLQAPDVAYVIAHRIGSSRTFAAAASQEWNFYYVWTDVPIPAATDGEYQAINETFIPKGIINFKSILSS